MNGTAFGFPAPSCTQAAHKIAVSCQHVLVASFPGLCCFQLHEKRACDIRGRKVLIEHGHTGAQDSKKS